jgi:molybdate transport system substrate-binding protein
VVALILVACAGSAPPRELVVFAASSLDQPFREMAATFEVPGTSVTLNLAGSQQLAAQIVQGGPADIFASADLLQMEVVADAGLLATEPVAFASNRLVIVVEEGNPLGIRSLTDLADPRLVVVLAAPEVPAGRYARAAIASAGLVIVPDSLELDARAVLAKVVIGEADAGIVYATCAQAAADTVDPIELPAASATSVIYTIAVVSSGSSPEMAAEFVELVLSETGRRALARHGFNEP